VLEPKDVHTPLDAVVASRSLHHMEDLTAAIEKIATLLRVRGLLVLHEHAWDRLDRATAQWYRRYLAQLDPARAGSLTSRLRDWEADHAGLHGYAAMRGELDRHFKEVLTSSSSSEGPSQGRGASSNRGRQDPGNQVPLRR
jgi:SAM-dependent methyltransferase